MKKTISEVAGISSHSSEELLRTVQADIKFYTENEDGTFTLQPKTIEEIEDMFGKCMGLN